MNSNSPPPDDSWESDAVWKLLERVPPQPASSRFADNTVRASRLAVETQPWWHRLFSPAPLAGLTASVLALALTGFSLLAPSSELTDQTAGLYSAQAVVIQDIAEAETLIAAVDHLDDFSDNELVSLIGF